MVCSVLGFVCRSSHIASAAGRRHWVCGLFMASWPHSPHSSGHPPGPEGRRGRRQRLRQVHVALVPLGASDAPRRLRAPLDGKGGIRWEELYSEIPSGDVRGLGL